MLAFFFSMALLLLMVMVCALRAHIGCIECAECYEYEIGAVECMQVEGSEEICCSHQKQQSKRWEKKIKATAAIVKPLEKKAYTSK